MTAPIYYDSTEAGAPVLNNAAGSLIALLRAVLINGFNVRAITGIVVAGGVATVTCPAHGFSSVYGKWLRITGANVPALNGTKQQTIVDANTFTYPAVGVANGNYTATDARRAPLGWTEPYVNGGATVAIYQRSAPEATAQMLRVDDLGTAPTDARAMCIETATGVDTFTGQAPSLAGGMFWWKGANSAAAKRWRLVGDELGFYFFTDLSSAGHYRCFPFGDLVTFKAGDAFHCMIGGQLIASSGAGNLGWLSPSAIGNVPAGDNLVLARRNTQVGGAVRAGVHCIGLSYPGTSGPTFPSPVDGGCVLSAPFFVNEDVAGSGNPIRGYAPGLVQPLAVRPFADGQVVENVVGTNDKFLAVPMIAANQGQVMVNLTSWR